MQEFFDNINYKVIDDLRVSISKGSRLSIAAATFSIYAFQELEHPVADKAHTSEDGSCSTFW